MKSTRLLYLALALVVLVSIVAVSCKKGVTEPTEQTSVPPDTVEYLVGIEIEGSGVASPCWQGWYYRLWNNFYFDRVDGCTTSTYHISIVDPSEGLCAKVYSLSSDMELRISFVDTVSGSVLSEIQATVDSSDFLELQLGCP